MDKKYKTLLIDDEPALLTGLSTIMKRQGYEVLVAENGTDGFEIAQREIPDVIVSDLMMPPPNGFELQAMLQENSLTKDIPFIFLTARTDIEDKLEGIKQGADDYITKPFDREELIVRVEAILRRKEIEREHGRQEMASQLDKQMENFKQEVLRNFQHEIFTPITNIMLPLKAIVSQKFNTEEELARFTESALSNANRLQSLIEDVSLLTNIDQNNLNTYRQEIKLDNEIQKIIKTCNSKYVNKNISTTWELKGSNIIFAPRREFRRALTHLIDNAYKFNKENGKLTIQAMTDKNGGCQITIMDEGPGIPDSQKEKVFERLNQVSQGSARGFEGLGVGLTISRAVARALGGDVQILDTTHGCHIILTIAAKENTPS